jgi:hypothetical protein
VPRKPLEPTTNFFYRNSPACVVAFNAERWSRDATDDIAGELAQVCADRGETPPFIADFIADNMPSRAR